MLLTVSNWPLIFHLKTVLFSGFIFSMRSESKRPCGERFQDDNRISFHCQICINKLSPLFLHLIHFVVPDIDECSTHRHRCSQNCHNNVGSYTCSCDAGYNLDSDYMTCSGKYPLFWRWSEGSGRGEWGRKWKSIFRFKINGLRINPWMATSDLYLCIYLFIHLHISFSISLPIEFAW